MFDTHIVNRLAEVGAAWSPDTSRPPLPRQLRPNNGFVRIQATAATGGFANMTRGHTNRRHARERCVVQDEWSWCAQVLADQLLVCLLWGQGEFGYWAAVRAAGGGLSGQGRDGGSVDDVGFDRTGLFEVEIRVERRVVDGEADGSTARALLNGRT
ncbi:hypothetical protein ACFYMW_31040 [Streptomyces sp. NPDC006692]|uniref:hypothetical protein n=1 Tax=unclassified Streptomyces TaxID=2593676 RepID=UPI0036BEED4A